MNVSLSVLILSPAQEHLSPFRIAGADLTCQHSTPMTLLELRTHFLRYNAIRV